MIADTFMIAAELDMLECRLVELDGVVDRFVAVEADVDHQGHPKPYHLTDNLARFHRWADKLVVIRASGLPATADHWDREHAQREWVRHGVADLPGDTIILHGDVDEIPTVTWARNVRPRSFVVAGQKFHPFAVDWLHPQWWPGTVAAPKSMITTYAAMRDTRLHAPVIVGSGWHFSWVGQAGDKLASFAHPEVAGWAGDLITNGDLWANGYHVDGTRLDPVTVDHTWPRWIAERACPPGWFRPDTPRHDLDVQAGPIVKIRG